MVACRVPEASRVTLAPAWYTVGEKPSAESKKFLLLNEYSQLQLILLHRVALSEK